MSSPRLWNPTWKAGIAAVLAAGITLTEGCSPPEKGSVKLSGNLETQSRGVVSPLAKGKNDAPKSLPKGIGRDIKTRPR